jgi:peroxiredoxin
MKKILILTCIVFALSGCHSDEYHKIFKLSYKDSSVLRFHVSNCHDTLNFDLYYEDRFLTRGITQNIIFCKDSTYQITIQINHPERILFYKKGDSKELGFFSIPRDTLEIYLNADSTLKLPESIKYEGKTASISNYLTKAKLEVHSEPKKEDGIDSYNRHIDSLTQKRLNVLVEFDKKEKLPDWYMKYEKLDIAYLGAVEKLDQFNMRSYYYNQNIPRPSNFINNLGIKIDNPDAYFCYGYLDILCNIGTEKFDTLLLMNKVTDKIFFQFVCENINAARKHLSGETRSIFIASRIACLLRSDMLERSNDSLSLKRIDSLITSVKTSITDTAIYSYLLDYRNEQLLNLEKSEELKKGDNAPGFYLKSLDGKMVKLYDFRGHEVIINFWAPWCVPCLRSIDEKNKLFQDYEKRGLVLLNVCIDPDEEQWKKVIQIKQFLGIHLICKGKWKDILTKSYKFSGIPHFTLIDKNGNIISNRIRNTAELETLLKEEYKKEK